MKKAVLLLLLCVSISSCSPNAISGEPKVTEETAITELGIDNTETTTEEAELSIDIEDTSIPEVEPASETLSPYDEGNELSESLVNEMENIDWDENYDKAEDLGKDLANYLNQFLVGGDD